MSDILTRLRSLNRMTDVFELMDDAASEIEKLTSELAQTCKCRTVDGVEVSSCEFHEARTVALHEWAERAKAAEAEIEKLQADAARYQWWRINCTRLIISADPVCIGEREDGSLILASRVRHISVNENFREAEPESVDAATAAAMKETP